MKPFITLIVLVLAACQSPQPAPVPADTIEGGVSDAAEDASCVVFFIGYWKGSCRGVPENVAETLAQKVNFGSNQ